MQATDKKLIALIKFRFCLEFIYISPFMLVLLNLDKIILRSIHKNIPNFFI
jgi:hypothetical protein